MKINKLKTNEIFVFGSNLAGSHGAGAALQAQEQFGAEDGVGEGLTGQTYAFPTLGKNLEKRNYQALLRSVDKLYNVCLMNLDKDFLLTKVGTGIAGYPEKQMKDLFKHSPVNLIKPIDWK